MKNFFVISVISITLFSCISSSTKILKAGYIDCFQENTRYADSTLTYCEASAILYYNNKMYFASDKSIPEHSSVFYCNFYKNEFDRNIQYIDYDNFKSAKKFEDFALSSDKKYFFLTTGFDRFDKTSNSFDEYCTLLYWPAEKNENVKILSMEVRKNVKSSYPLYTKLLEALQSEEYPKGVKYFKIEGLAEIPGKTLLFGVREMGYDYSNFKYCVKILSVNYTFEKEEIVLTSEPELVYSFVHKPSEEINFPIGLSSIEYDSFHNQLYILTSIENKGNSGAYIWKLPLNGLKWNQKPELLRDKNKKPLFLSHKAEDLTIINKNTIAIICDDDRTLEKKSESNQELNFIRKPHQSAYYIIKTK